MKIFVCLTDEAKDEPVIVAGIDKFNAMLNNEEEMTVILGMGTWTSLAAHLFNTYGDDVKIKGTGHRRHIDAGCKKIFPSPSVDEGCAIFVTAGVVDEVFCVLPYVKI